MKFPILLFIGAGFLLSGLISILIEAAKLTTLVGIATLLMGIGGLLLFYAGKSYYQ